MPCGNFSGEARSVRLWKSLTGNLGELSCQDSMDQISNPKGRRSRAPTRASSRFSASPAVSKYVFQDIQPVGADGLLFRSISRYSGT
jgi:hypothetical protein